MTTVQPAKAGKTVANRQKLRAPAMRKSKTKSSDLLTIVDCGWGRLIFGQTSADPRRIAKALQEEEPGRRDIAFYVSEPHLVLAQAPQALFLDPSHTFRLDLTGKRLKRSTGAGIVIRKARRSDEAGINAIYASHGMVPLREGYIAALPSDGPVRIMVAEDKAAKRVAGVVMGVDHNAAFDDPDNGASLWALAVDARTALPGIGQKLVLGLAAAHQAAGRSYMDLSVMHDNTEAIALYEKLGFTQVPVFSVKMKNQINELLFIGPEPNDELNIYATIITDEARRRGIAVDIEDAEAGLFKLSLGGRSICCRESLSDLTSAVAMSRCDDKALTHRLLAAAGLDVPRQETITGEAEAVDFLNRYGRVVIKPARGEQGTGVAVDLRSNLSVTAAFRQARDLCERVLAEEFVSGEDLRIIVIAGEVVAAAIRRPASIVGDGAHSIMALIDKQSRRRSAATKGESRIPLDAETERCVRQAGHSMHDVLPDGELLVVRKTANLHTGGTIHDVTQQLHPKLAQAASKGAGVLDMPVVGFDMIVAAPHEPEYRFIEANERPGLANHEPAPTAEKFIDLLFPQTKAPTRATAN
ncbi:MAG TPA: N-acetylglutaminylglutamine synthetase [Hyphomicrobiaceae bacterium]|nr:N-acetylglutaminylglutamine synthetase [Hyphomicrobiaceae bacterium]